MKYFTMQKTVCESNFFTVPKRYNFDNITCLQFICRVSWHMVSMKVIFLQYSAYKNTFLKLLFVLSCAAVREYLFELPGSVALHHAPCGNAYRLCVVVLA